MLKGGRKHQAIAPVISPPQSGTQIIETETTSIKRDLVLCFIEK
jgi:hypothetical protein